MTALFEKKSTNGCAFITDARNCSIVIYHSILPCLLGFPFLSGD